VLMGPTKLRDKAGPRTKGSHPRVLVSSGPYPHLLPAPDFSHKPVLHSGLDQVAPRTEWTQRKDPGDACGKRPGEV
jgi:hypothetical protein